MNIFLVPSVCFSKSKAREKLLRLTVLEIRTICKHGKENWMQCKLSVVHIKLLKFHNPMPLPCHPLFRLVLIDFYVTIEKRAFEIDTLWNKRLHTHNFSIVCFSKLIENVHRGNNHNGKLKSRVDGFWWGVQPSCEKFTYDGKKIERQMEIESEK